MTQPLGPLLALLPQRNHAAITAEIERLLTTATPLGDRWDTVAKIARANQEMVQYRRAMANFARHAPADGHRRLLAAAAHAEGGDFAGALTWANATSGPHAANAAHLRGTLHLQLGNTDTAIAELHRALAIDPALGPSWLALSALIRFQPGPDLDALQAVARNNRRPDRAPLLHALGKAFDDIGDTDAAFAAFTAAAAAVSAGPRYDAAAYDRLVDAVIADFVTPAPDNTNAPHTRALFVMGLPRSGTTLVEQILASHSAVAGGGELNLFSLAASPVAGPTRRDALRYLDRTGNWTAIRRHYEHLLDVRYGPAGRIVDKTLSHSLVLGLIASIHPDAPLVWVRRDPLDVAWSCFRTHFPTGLPWTRSLPDIADTIRASERLLAHWQSVLGPRLLVIDYEALVSDFDAQARRLLEHCRLDPEPGVAQFYQTRRPVLSASVAQVRRPLDATAIGGARRYAAHLSAFTDRYNSRNQAWRDTHNAGHGQETTPKISG